MFDWASFCSHRSWMLLTCRVRLGTGSGWEKEPSLAQGSLSSNRRMSPVLRSSQLTVNHGSSDQMAHPRKGGFCLWLPESGSGRPTLPLDASSPDDDIDIALGRPHLLGALSLGSLRFKCRRDPSPWEMFDTPRGSQANGTVVLKSTE